MFKGDFKGKIKPKFWNSELSEIKQKLSINSLFYDKEYIVIIRIQKYAFKSMSGDLGECSSVSPPLSVPHPLPPTV